MRNWSLRRSCAALQRVNAPAPAHRSMSSIASETTPAVAVHESAPVLNPGMHNQVIVLAGATAVGKSKVAQLLCRHIGNCEVVVADSVQIYSHLDVGSNKPSAAEQAEFPHHCVSLVQPADTYSGGEFVREAVSAIYDILNRGKVPVVVGGSTMWIQWLVQGIPDAPKADAAVALQAESLLREATQAQDWSAALAILTAHAPERASKIGANDWYRCRRYLEVALSTKDLPAEEGGDALKGERTAGLPGLDVRCFFMNEQRDDLYRTIDTRCEGMLEAGLLQEVAALVLDRHLAPNTVAAKAIGYRQTLEYLGLPCAQQDPKAFQRYLTEFTTATRNYAKRQLHWYRKDKQFLWLQIQRHEEGDLDEPYRRVLRELCHWRDAPRHKYDRMVKHQLLRAAAVSKMRTWVKSKPKGDSLTDFDWLAVAAMVAAGEIRPPQGQAIIGDEQAGWATAFSVSSDSDGETPPVRSGAGRRRAVNDREDAGGEDADMFDEDDALEAMSLQGTRNPIPRTLPEFPNPPLPPSEWTAEDVLIRAAEVNVGGKGQRTPMANKLRSYTYDAVAAAQRLEGVFREAAPLAARLREEFPGLLGLFYPDADKQRERRSSRSPSPPPAETADEGLKAP